MADEKETIDLAGKDKNIKFAILYSPWLRTHNEKSYITFGYSSALQLWLYIIGSCELKLSCLALIDLFSWVF